MESASSSGHHIQASVLHINIIKQISTCLLYNNTAIFSHLPYFIYGKVFTKSKGFRSQNKFDYRVAL